MSEKVVSIVDDPGKMSMTPLQKAVQKVMREHCHFNLITIPEGLAEVRALLDHIEKAHAYMEQEGDCTCKAFHRLRIGSEWQPNPVIQNTQHMEGVGAK